MPKKKLSIKFIRKQFKLEKYILLTKNYENNKQKLKYICPNGHEHIISWHEWYNGNRCPYCSNKIKKTIEFIREEFKKEEYILLSKKYKNANTKLDYVCPRKHEHKITWHEWDNGSRCPYCANRPPVIINTIKSSFEMEGYELLTTVYKDCHQKLSYICPNGHECSICWNNWKSGKRCPTCDDIKKTGPGSPNWKGGISFEPYCPVWKDKEFKEFIKQRDSYKCMNPCCSSNDPNDLVGHHIDYNKKNCDPSNIITICRSCNGGANKDREWHTVWYGAIMYMRYGYVY